MSIRAKKLVLVFCVAVFVCLILVWQADKGSSVIKSGMSDLSLHPVYSQYRFAEDENVIHIGNQPMWIFVGNVGETMKRDRILREALAKLNMRIQFHSFLKGTDVNSFVQAGYLDGGMCGDMPILRIATAMEITVPALVGQSFGDIIAQRSMLVTDLKGKRIAYPFGSLSHYALMEALDSAGISADQVQLVSMDIDEMPQAMREGKIDACAVWEPNTSIILAGNPQSTVIYRSRYLGVLYFRKDFAERHPDAVRHILAAEARAIRWMKDSKNNLLRSSQWALDAGKQLSVEGPELSPLQIAEIISSGAMVGTVPVIPERDLSDGGHLHREFQFLTTTGQLPASSSWDNVRKMFDRDIMREILSQSVKYRLDEFNYENGEREE